MKKIKKQILVLTALISLLMLAVPVMAVPLKAAPYQNFPKHLYLFEKDPETWCVVDGGSWGKLNVEKGVFNGHGLEPCTEYSLYANAEWGVTMTLLGSGISDCCGDIHIKSDVVACGKVWLVLSADVTCDVMSGWNPTEYLFEYAVLP